MFDISEKDLANKLMISRQSLQYARNGHINVKWDINGNKIRYFVEPKLKIGLHFEWNEGNLKYDKEKVFRALKK